MQPTSIFIVEDEAIVADDLSETLISLGYAVAGMAKSGETAFKEIAETKPDLVLMDIYLSGSMDGIETAENIHKTLNIPVIYLTAYADELILDRAKVTEPYGYILKPYEERGLKSTIEIALYKHRMEEQVKEKERTIQVLANAIPDSVMLLDTEKHIIALNDAMALRLGYTNISIYRDSAMQYPWNEVFTSMESQIRELLHSGLPVRFEEKIGDDWFEISLILISGQDEQNSRIFIQYHNITDHKRFEEQLKKEGIIRVELNMEEFQILNDQIRNPLQAIMGYVNLDCGRYQQKIIEQIKLIDNLVDRLDHGWVESEKVRRFLIRHYRYNPADISDPVTGGKPGGGQ